jgi:hypothetical protein
MYVDQQSLQRGKNLERLKEVGALALLVVLIALEYKAVRDVLIRLTHNLVVTETQEIQYRPAGLGLWSSPSVKYRWKGVDYESSVGGLFIANSAAIIPPVKVLVDPESPTTAVLKTPYGGWGVWTADFVFVQVLVAGFIYVAFGSSYIRRKKSYFL